MAHLTYIEDKDGNVVDVEVYCCDYCAKGSDYYSGWNGCHEISSSEPCVSCGDTVVGLEQYAAL